MTDGNARDDDTARAWRSNGVALDRCMANPLQAPPDAVDQVERVWQDVLLNKFGAREALAEMLKSSNKVRARFRNSLWRFANRFGGRAELEAVVNECLDFVATVLTKRRHQAADSPFEAGLDFPTWNALRGYLFMRTKTHKLLTRAEDFIRERKPSWMMSNVEDLAEYGSDGRPQSRCDFDD